MSTDYGVLIEDEGVAQRALFIIDPKGMVRSITVNDADVGRSVDEALRILDALVFKDEFGEGCPVDWKKGDKGIDIASKNRVEGNVELKKSWSEWARPKLNRAWSAASQRSIASVGTKDYLNGHHRLLSDSDNHLSPTIPTSGSISGTGGQSGFSSGQQSPYIMSPILSPTNNSQGNLQSQLDRAMRQQKYENMHAAMENEAQSIGTAS